MNWISVKDRLPDHQQIILVFAKTNRGVDGYGVATFIESIKMNEDLKKTPYSNECVDIKKYPYYFFHKQKVNLRKEVLETGFKALLNQFQIDDAHFEKLLELVRIHLDKCLVNKKKGAEKLRAKVNALKTKQSLILDKNIEGIIK